MSISSSLTALQAAKTNIAAAITAKGGTVNEGDGFSDFATDIGTISGGGTTPDIYPIGSDCRPYGDVVLSSNITSIYNGANTSTGNVHLFANSSTITSVTGSAVTFVGQYAFCNSTSITAVNFPALTTVSSNAFTDTSGLTSITFPPTIQILGQQAFYRAGLTSLTLPSGEVTINANAFSNCLALQTISLGADSGAGTISLSGDTQFANCTSLVSADVSRCNRITTGMFRMNSENTTFTTLVLPAVTYAGGFTAVNNNNPIYRCCGLQNITVGSGWSLNVMFSDDSTNFSNEITHDSIVGIFNALADYTGGTVHTIRFGATNLARVTEAEIAIATAKNWTVS